MSEHAKLSASGADRWMNCPGSVALSDGLESTSSIYALEGTAAHELAERCLLGDLDPHKETDNKDMADAVLVYLEYVRKIQEHDESQVEASMTLEHLHPDMNIMTGDFIGYDKNAKHIDVVDYKHGSGMGVDVYDNAQLKIYGLAALYQYERARTVSVHIVQPRYDHPDGPCRVVTYGVEELLEWEKEILEAAARVDAGENPCAGPWCKWCPAKEALVCPILNETAQKAAQADFSEEMNETDLAEALDDVPQIEEWLKAVKALAFRRASHGWKIPGYKIVAKRAIRQWVDEKKALSFLMSYGLDEDDLFSTKMKSPAQIETVIGKDNKEDITDYVTKKSSGEVLVSADDNRPEVKADAQSDFS